MEIILFILLLAVLILSHEAGHFFAAKLQGIGVEEFGFGFPPRVLSVLRRGTRYSFNLLPLGGFVKILGEDGGDQSDPKNFASRSVAVRVLVVAAGVLMNVAVAFILFSLGHWWGLPSIVEDGSELAEARVTILEVSLASPAEEAGLRPGDAVVLLESSTERLEVGGVEDFQNFIERHKGQAVSFSLVRGQEKLLLKAAPRLEPPEGQGPLGVRLGKVGIKRYPWYAAIWQGLRSTFVSIVLTFQALAMLLANIFTGDLTIAKSLSGPVGIYFFVGDSLRLGLAYFVQFAALLSINLAVLNILPIPALDGGRILLFVLEKIKGMPVFTPQTERLVHTVSFMILLGLMLLVTYRDIIKFF